MKEIPHSIVWLGGAGYVICNSYGKFLTPFRAGWSKYSEDAQVFDSREDAEEMLRVIQAINRHKTINEE